MKNLLLISGLLIIAIESYSQSIEILPSLSLSSEPRFKCMIGAGISYCKNLLENNREIGLTLSYNNGYSEHERDLNTGTSDHDYRLLKTNAVKYSVRLNYTYSLLNSNRFDIRLGPEISYNLIDYTDKIYLLNGEYLYDINDRLNKIGIGLATKYELKNIRHSGFSIIARITGTVTTYEWGNKSYNWQPWLIGWLNVETGLRYTLVKKD